MSPPRARTLRRLAPLLLLVGAIVMVVFDTWFTLLAGVVLLLAFVVVGVFAIADPEGFLDRDDVHEDAEDAVVGGADDATA